MFLIVFIYEMETLKSSASQGLHHIGNNMGRQQFSPPQTDGNEMLQSALALMVANELSYLGEVATRVVNKLHPDLKDELRYSSFKTSIQTRRSTAGRLTFEPLKQYYKEDYDKLRARYDAEHPNKPLVE